MLALTNLYKYTMIYLYNLIMFIHNIYILLTLIKIPCYIVSYIHTLSYYYINIHVMYGNIKKEYDVY